MSNFTISSSYPVPSVMSRTEFEDIIKNLVPASDLIASSDLHISNNKIAIKADGVDIDQLDLASSDSNLEDAGLGKIRVAQTMTGLTSVTSTSFTGALSGNVTGNVTGNLTGNISSASGNLEVNPATQILEVKGDGSSNEGKIQLNCHANSHGQKITAADHSVSATNTLTLPGGTTIGNSDATLVSDTGTQTLSNKTLTSPTITGSGAIAGVFTGNLTGNVTGNVTGDVTGDLTGDVTGDVTGNLTGNVTGNVTGNLTGNVTGNVTGDLTGDVSGNVTGDLTGDVTGNADTATTLETLGGANQILAMNNAGSAIVWIDNTPSLAALTDTNLTTPDNNTFLIYDDTSSKWIDRPLLDTNVAGLTYTTAGLKLSSAINNVITQMSLNGTAESGKTLTVHGDAKFNDKIDLGGAEFDRIGGIASNSSSYHDIWKGMAPFFTTLSSAVGTTDTTISLTDSSQFKPTGSVVINGEQIDYTSNSSNTLSGLTRGASGTTISAHSSGATVTPSASQFGLLLHGYPNGQTIVAVQANDVRDGFYVLTSDATPSGYETTDRHIFSATSEGVIINEHGHDYLDFRVEGDTNENLLFCDASADTVEIGNLSINGSALANMELTVNGNARVHGDNSGSPTEVFITDPTADARLIVKGNESSVIQQIAEGTASDDQAELFLIKAHSSLTSDNVFNISNIGATTSFLVNDYHPTNGMGASSTSCLAIDNSTGDIDLKQKVKLSGIQEGTSGLTTGQIYKDSNGFLKVV